MNPATTGVRQHDRFARKAVYLLAFLCFALVCSYRIALAFYPTPNTGGAENSIIYFIQRLLSGQSLYPDPEQPPYAIAQYAPLYYYLVGGIARIFSVNANEVYQLFLVNRLSSLALHLLLSLLVAGSLKNVFAIKWSRALIAGLMVLILIPGSSRPDNLSVLLWFCSFHFFIKTLVKPAEKIPVAAYFLTALFACLAVLAKQNSITIIAVILTWLLLQGAAKKAFAFLVCLAITGAAFALAALLLYDVDALYKNIVLGVNNGINVSDYVFIFWEYYCNNGLLVFLAMIITLFLLFKNASAPHRFMAIAILMQFFFSNVLGLKAGSGINYLSEWILLVVMGTALHAGQLEQMFAHIRPTMGLLLFSIVLLIKAFPFVPQFLWYSDQEFFTTSMDRYKNEQKVAAYVQPKPADNFFILTDISTPKTFFSNLCGPRLLLPQSDIINTVYNRNVFDYAGFKNAVKSGAVKYIITKNRFDTLHFRDLRLTGYQLDTTIADYLVYANDTITRRQP